LFVYYLQICDIVLCIIYDLIIDKRNVCSGLVGGDEICGSDEEGGQINGGKDEQYVTKTLLL